MNIIPLYDNIYAVEFPYAIVTEMTLSRAIPYSFRREAGRDSLQIKFAAETQETAGTKRADCEEMAKIFPAEVAILSGQVKDLSKYVIFKLVN